MLQFRQFYTRVGLTDRIQELPYALGTVASRADESGHHGCISEIHGITYSFPVDYQSLAMASVTSGAGSLLPIPARQYTEPLLFDIGLRLVLGCHGSSPSPAAGMTWVRVLLWDLLLLVPDLLGSNQETVPVKTTGSLMEGIKF